MRLPGYEAQLDESGVDHSRRKLLRAAEELLAKSLPGLPSPPAVIVDADAGCRRAREGDCDDDDDDAAVVLDVLPCRSEGETLGYRCRCTFQLIPAPPSTSVGCGGGDGHSSFSHDVSADDDDCRRRPLAYAMRSGGVPVPLGGDHFPIATPRIQRAMRSFLRDINSLSSSRKDDDDGNTDFRFHRLRRGLTSVSFASSWDGTDCLATLHYSEPLPTPPRPRRRSPEPKEDEVGSSTSKNDECPTGGGWTEEAELVRLSSDLTALTGRSRGVRLSVPLHLHHSKSSTSEDEGGGVGRWGDDDDVTGTSCIIRDEVRVSLGRRCSLGGDGTNNRRNHSGAEQHEEGEVGRTIVVRYRKPETAFQHPNGGVMVQALEWILGRLVGICEGIQRCGLDDGGMPCRRSRRRPNLLEMYCGFGAHTVAIGKTGAFGRIVAVELDRRLVDACVENVELNDCCGKIIDDDSGEESSTSSFTTPVHVVKSDAGEVARRILARRRRRREASTKASGGGGALPGDDDAQQGGVVEDRSTTPSECRTDGDLDPLDLDFDVLLVDPPRSGLDGDVLRLAVEGGFTHVIYVSCGRRALVRDLSVLTTGGEGDAFDVTSCRLLDLFPRTYSVETLVHLTRRRGRRGDVRTGTATTTTTAQR